MTIKLLAPVVLAAGLAWGAAMGGAAMAADPTAPAAAAASGTQTAGAPDLKKPDAPADAKICRRLEVTGSRLGKERVCKTKQEWARYDQEQSDENARDQSYIDSNAARNMPR